MWLCCVVYFCLSSCAGYIQLGVGFLDRPWPQDPHYFGTPLEDAAKTLLAEPCGVCVCVCGCGLACSRKGIRGPCQRVIEPHKGMIGSRPHRLMRPGPVGLMGPSYGPMGPGPMGLLYGGVVALLFPWVFNHSRGHGPSGPKACQNCNTSSQQRCG